MRRVVAVCAAYLLSSCGGSDLSSSVRPLNPDVRIAVREGNGQTGEVGRTLPVPVTVQVIDVANGGAPVSGQLLLWVISRGAGRVDLQTTRTDAEGYSRQSWTLGTFAGQDSMDVWLVSPKGYATASTSVGAAALHGPAITGGHQCDPIAFSLAANVPIPIVDSVRVFARDRFNNVWPYAAKTTVEDVRFSGRVTGSSQPPSSFTARTVTLAPSDGSGGAELGTSWQGGWIVTLEIEGPEQESCTIGASAH